MIRRSYLLAALFLGMSVAVHAAMVGFMPPEETIEMAGGAPSSVARLGSNFEDMTAGVLTGDEAVEMPPEDPVELPGRGTRFCNPCVTYRAALVHQIAQDLASLKVGDTPLVLMGHSMGATLAYEVGLALGGDIPLILSGRAAPLRAQVVAKWMSDEDILERIKSHGGTPDEVLNCPEMLDLMLPILRADYDLLARQAEQRILYNAPALLLGGLADPEVPMSALTAWNDIILSTELRTFPGGHFFVSEHSTCVQAHIRVWLETH